VRVSIEEAIAIVKLKYPDARVVGIPSLSVKDRKEWYQVVSGRRISWIGQGSTIRKAWIFAAEMVVEGIG